MKRLLSTVAVAVLSFVSAVHAAPAKNVIVVTIDGLRWQEVMGGIDPLQIAKPEDGKKPSADITTLRNKYLRPTPQEQRERLMPFMWGTIAKQGQIFGDRTQDCVAEVTNPHWFSYPGYSELSEGFVEPRIKSNDNVLNPNATVFEWLNNKPEFNGQVAAFGAWDRLYALINPQRSGIFCMAGWRPIPTPPGGTPSATQQVLQEMMQSTTRYWADEPFDIYCQTEALDYIKQYKPRVAYIMLGETDDWAHANKYDLYLQAIEKSDEFLRRLWEQVQSMPEYKDQTAILITCDHGRGEGPKWTSHGSSIPGSNGIWIAVMGAGVDPKGVRQHVKVTQSQVAATIAKLIDQDYNAAVPAAAQPLPGVCNP